MKNTIKIAVTGAAGHIGYALLFRLASGEVFGPQTPIQLNLLELEKAIPTLQGVVMELDDCAFPLLKKVLVTSNPNEAFAGADWAILLGSVPRKAGMERSDLLKINGGVFIEQGQALDKNANSNCKVLVVGNPCNTNAYIAKTVAKRLSPRNFFAMIMLDQNRAAAQLAQKAGVGVCQVSHLAVWGNHSTTQFPNFYHSKIDGRSVLEVIRDEDWLKTTFLETVQNRGAAVIQARGLSSAASAANAAIDTVKNLITPTREGEWFSVAVCSDGSYGIEKGLMYSYPVRSDGHSWKIVEGLELNAFAQEKIKATEKELIAEREAVKDMLL
jgi:malate dehydrogenase